MSNPVFVLDCADDVTQSCERASSWLMLCMRNGAWKAWKTIVDRNQNLLNKIFELAFGAIEKGQLTYISDLVADQARLEVLTPTGWETEKLALDSLMPNNEPDYTLEIVRDEVTQ